MKTIRLLLPLLILLNLTAYAQRTEVKNLTIREYQREVDRLVAQGYRPVKERDKTLGCSIINPAKGPNWATGELLRNGSLPHPRWRVMG